MTKEDMIRALNELPDGAEVVLLPFKLTAFADYAHVAPVLEPRIVIEENGLLLKALKTDANTRTVYMLRAAK